jgi:hypothetical protein
VEAGLHGRCGTDSNRRHVHAAPPVWDTGFGNSSSVSRHRDFEEYSPLEWRPEPMLSACSPRIIDQPVEDRRLRESSVRNPSLRRLPCCFRVVRVDGQDQVASSQLVRVNRMLWTHRYDDPVLKALETSAVNISPSRNVDDQAKSHRPRRANVLASSDEPSPVAAQAYHGREVLQR